MFGFIVEIVGDIFGEAFFELLFHIGKNIVGFLRDMWISF